MSPSNIRLLAGRLLLVFTCVSCGLSSDDSAAGRYVKLPPDGRLSDGAGQALVTTYELRKDGTWQSKDSIGGGRAEPLDGMTIISWGRFSRDEYGIKFSLDSSQSSWRGVPDKMLRIDSTARQSLFSPTSWGAMVRVDTLIFPSAPDVIGGGFTYYIRASQ